MRILQSGMPKSGNFWLWQILQQIITEAGLPNESFIQRHPVYPIAKTWELSFAEQADIDVLDIIPYAQFFRISSIFRMPVGDLDTYLSQTNHVWTHSNFNIGSKAVFPKFDKIVYILRDPRDVILSQSRFAFTPYRQRFLPSAYENTEKFLNGQIPEMSERWQKHVSNHLLNREEYNIHIVFYERLLMDFEAEFAKLIDYLGVPLNAEQSARIKQAVQFETMQQVNPQHLSKGKSYKWMDSFSPEQQNIVMKQTGTLLEMLGYPLTSQDEATLPSLEAASPHTVKRLIQSKRLKPFLKRLLRRALIISN
jgi:aryl sulfotransferase